MSGNRYKDAVDRVEEATRYAGGKTLMFETPKPARQGDTAEYLFRVVPRHELVDDVPDLGRPLGEFWVETVSHRITSGGNTSYLTCGDGMKQNPITCPLCQLRKEAYQRKDKTLGASLQKRMRFYLYVLDLNDPQSHWVEDPESPSGWTAQPKVLACSKTVWQGIMVLCAQKRPAEDLTHGMDLKLLVKNTGPEAKDVDYDVIDMDPGPVDPAWRPVVERCGDLGQFDRPVDWEALEEATQALGGRSTRKGGTSRSSASRSSGPDADIPWGGPVGGASRGPAPAAARPFAPGPPASSLPPAPGAQSAGPWGAPAASAPAPGPRSAPPAVPAGPPPRAAAPPPPAPVVSQTLYSTCDEQGQQHHDQTVPQVVARCQQLLPTEKLIVWTDGMADWAPAESIPEIRAALASARQPAQRGAPPGFGPGPLGGPPKGAPF